MTRRLRDAGLGVIFAAIGVVNFAFRLSDAREPVDIATGLLFGFATVVAVRLVLGLLSSGRVVLAVVGTTVGLFEMVFLLSFHVDSSQSLFNFLVCAVADLLVIAIAWAVLVAGLAGARLRRRRSRVG